MYQLIEILPDGRISIVYDFYDNNEAEKACLEMSSKYPHRLFALR